MRSPASHLAQLFAGPQRLRSSFLLRPVCALPVVFAYSAKAQRCAQDMTPTSLVPPSLYAVQGAPYTGEFEQVWTEPGTGVQHRIVSRELVDTKGRQRYEFGSDECAGSISATVQVKVYDVVARTTFSLDEVRRQISTGTLPPTHTDPIHVPPGGWPDQADPRPRDSPQRIRISEPQQIAGLLALGTRTTTVRNGAQVVDELWVSPRYRMPLMRVHIDPRRGTVITRMLRLTLGDPDERLFESPAGYTSPPAHLP